MTVVKVKFQGDNYILIGREVRKGDYFMQYDDLGIEPLAIFYKHFECPLAPEAACLRIISTTNTVINSLKASEGTPKP